MFLCYICNRFVCNRYACNRFKSRIKLVTGSRKGRYLFKGVVRIYMMKYGSFNIPSSILGASTKYDNTMLVNIKEYILEKLQNTPIFEMAYSRKELKNSFDSILDQIIENWCLVKYCSLYDGQNINKKHWANELTAHMYNILKRQLKNGSEDAKLQLLKSVAYDHKEYTTASAIKKCIRLKFKKENIQITNELCSDCIEDLETILGLISRRDTEENYENIDTYIENL